MKRSDHRNKIDSFILEKTGKNKLKKKNLTRK